MIASQIEEQKSYIIEFDKNRTIKTKKYLIDCILRNNKCQPVIVITHDKLNFCGANNRV